MSKNLYLHQNSRILNPDHRDLEPERGAYGFGVASDMIRSVDLESRTVEAVVSTINVDRYGEIVDPEAYRKWLPTFMLNPVMMAGHVYSAPDGSPTSIGAWKSLQITDSGLEGKAQFLTDDELADGYWNRFKQGVGRAFSVGFIAHDWEMRDFQMKDGSKRRIRVFTEVELIEISAVAIPANRESLVQSFHGGTGANLKQTLPRDFSPDLIKSLCAELLREVLPAISKLFNEQLSTEPGSKLCTLFQDVVEATQRCGAHGHESDDVSSAGVARSALDQGEMSQDELRREIEEIRALLKQARGQ